MGDGLSRNTLGAAIPDLLARYGPGCEAGPAAFHRAGRQSLLNLGPSSRGLGPPSHLSGHAGVADDDRLYADASKSSRYKHAARQLSECDALASQIEDFRTFEPHAAYFGLLCRDHGRRPGFWGTLLDATLRRILTINANEGRLPNTMSVAR